MLFDRLQVPKTAPTNTTILVIGGAGGVGSITIQLLKQLTNLTIIATASRPETKEWVEQLGADYVLDHRQPLAAQIKQLGLSAPLYVFSSIAIRLRHGPRLLKTPTKPKASNRLAVAAGLSAPPGRK
ncbi:zinc-binding dehydrogenase [Klebsiella pneumoniae]